MSDLKKYKFHEIADIFPMMSEEEYKGLKSSINLNGLMVSIVIFEEKILDGRNRYNACQELKINPKYENYKGSYEEAINFVWIHNINRRHLDSSGRAVCGVKKQALLDKLAQAAKERQREAGKNGVKGGRGKKKTLSQKIDQGFDPNKNRTTQKLAEATGTNRQYISDAIKLKETEPDLFEDVCKGKKTIPQVKKEAKKRKLKRESEENSIDVCNVNDLQELINKGIKCKTIYADPPWQYSNQGTRSATDNTYQTMTIEQIIQLPIEDIADKEAHLHLWTTNAFLFESKKILEAWGFEYKSIFLWVKPKIGIGNYWRVSHEFLILGIRGKLPFLNNSIRSWEEIKKGKHSEKPEMIRKKIESVSPGPRLELFGRKLVKNWIVWGNEIQRKDYINKLDECV